MLRAKQPFEDWVRQLPHGPGPPEPIDLVTAFATPELPTQADADRWLAEHYEDMFERLLMPWAEMACWPADRSFATFQAWFDIVFAPNVDDMRDEGADDEDADYAHAWPEVTCAPLSLREVRERFLELPEDGSLHVDIESGELFAFTDEELDAIDVDMAEDLEMPRAELEALQDAFDSGKLAEIAQRRHLPLVDLMQDFVAMLGPGSVKNRLANALQGRKAERRFNDAIDLARLRPRWDRWFRRAVAGLMAISLVQLAIPYVDDVEPGDTEPARIDS